MKKILLATSALGVLAAATAHAAAPTVTIGGYADFQVGSASQEDAYEAAANESGGAAGTAGVFTRNTHTATDTEIHVKVDGKTDAGLGYGAYIEFEADVNQDADTGANNNVERSYLYVEGGFGRVEAGANTDAGSALKVNAATFARATGGVGGDFYRYIDFDGNVTNGVSDTFVVLPKLPTAGLPSEVQTHTTAARATANKISYYSPRISGIQVGASYTPDQGERGTTKSLSGTANTGDFESVWNLGANYQGEYNGVGVEASLVGELGDSEVAANDDLSAYALGLNVNYAGFTAGGSYGDSEEFGNTSTFGTSYNYWTAGVAYEFGPFAASATYLASTVENDTSATDVDKEFTNLVLGADYQLAPGLVPYVEVSFFETDDNTSASTDNEGTVILVGTELSF